MTISIDSGLAALILLVAAGAGPAAAAAGQTPAVGAEVENLRALPYLQVSAEPADPRRSGVTRLDPERSYPGYNLYTSTIADSVSLFAPGGRAVHTWRIPEGVVWNRVELLPSGDLLVIGGRRPARGALPAVEEGYVVETDTPAPGRFLLKMRWTGEILWQQRLPAHHDLEVLPDGRVLAFTTEHRLVPEVDPEIRVADNPIAVFSADGRQQDQVSLYDLVTSGPEQLAMAPVRPRRSGKRRRMIDLLHANNVDWVDASQLVAGHPLAGAESLLLTLRHQDTVAAVDWQTRELLWSWGRGELSGPHNAQLLAGGNVLIFDNGLRRKRSRIIELDPSSGEIVWQYQPPVEEPFFTRSGGACQRLANGNTLITDTNRGRAFEITRDGDVVWEFFTPHMGPRGRRGVIIRMQRYEVDFVRRIRSSMSKS